MPQNFRAVGQIPVDQVTFEKLLCIRTLFANAVTHNALVCLTVELHFHCLGITTSQDGKMMYLPLIEMLNKFVKEIRMTALAELHGFGDDQLTIIIL